MNEIRRPRLDYPMLEVDGQPVTLAEILASARLGGWLTADLDRLRDSLSCQSLAAEEEFQPELVPLQAAIDTWRRARNLSAAEETEAMLQTYGLELDDLVNYSRRYLLLKLYRNRLSEARQRFTPSKTQAERMLPSDVLFHRTPESLINDFALRVVADPAASIDAGERARLLKTSYLPPDHWADLLRDVYGVPAQRSDWLLRIELSFRNVRNRLVNADTLRREFEKNPLDLTRLEVNFTEAPDRDIAKELLCCIRADRETLAEAAAHAELSTQTATWFFSELDAHAFGSHLPAARVGDAFGPAPIGNRFLVLQLHHRHEADLSDPVTYARLEQQLIDRTLRKQASQRVQFLYTIILR